MLTSHFRPHTHTDTAACQCMHGPCASE